MSKREFQEGEVYLAKCKGSFMGGVGFFGEEGSILRCKKKWSNGALRWHITKFDAYVADEFGWVCDWELWKKYMHKPFSPLTKKDFIPEKEYLCIEDYKNFFVKGETYTCLISVEDGVYFKNKDLQVKLATDLTYFWRSTGEDSQVDLSEAFDTLLAVAEVFAKAKWYYEEDTPSYHFKDNNINWYVLTADLLEDNVPLAVIESEEEAYVCGVCNEDIEFYSEDVEFQWGDIFENFDMYGFNEPYGAYKILEIDPTRIQEVKELCKEYSQKYKDYIKKEKDKVLDRNRDKTNASTYKVWTY